MNFAHTKLNKKKRILGMLSLLFGLVISLQNISANHNLVNASENLNLMQPLAVTATSLAIQTDGKILVGGTDGANLVFVRYLFNGSLDPSFNFTGIRRVSVIRSTEAKIQALAVQPDGKIVGAGTDGTNVLVARLNSDSSLDTTFNAAGEQPGILLVAVPAIAQGAAIAIANAIALTPEKKIVFAGTDGSNFLVGQVLTEGVLDDSFNPSGTQPGLAITPIAESTNSAANAVIITPVGKYLVGGTDGSNFALARYLPTGDLDNTFNTFGPQPGVVTTQIGSSNMSQVRGVDVQTDQRIVAAGTDGTNFVLARYRLEGFLDPDFNAGGSQPGVVINELPNQGMANATAIQANGKILSTGFSLDEKSNKIFTLTRHLSSGSADEGFGVHGVVVTSIPSSAQANAGNIHVNGTPIAVGALADLSTGDQNFVAARYNTNGSIDKTFGDNGIVITDVVADSAQILKPKKKSSLSTIGQNLHNTDIVSVTKTSISGTAQNKSFVGVFVDSKLLDAQAITALNSSNDERDTNGVWTLDLAAVDLANNTQANVNQLLVGLTPGQHVIQASANYKAGNVIIDSEAITVCIPLLTVSLSPVPRNVCLGKTITLTANVLGGDALRYIWTTPNRGSITTQTNILTISDAKVSDSGNYTVIAVDVNGCSSDPSNPAFVNVGPAVILTTNCKLVSPCCPITVTATATGGTPPYQFTWSDDVTNLNVTGPITRTLILDNNPISVTVSDVNGCTATSRIHNSLSQAIKGKYCS